MKIGIAADHGGFALKKTIASFLTAQQFDVKDFGAHTLDAGDDFPDFIVPLAKAIANKEVDRGIAICGSGVGASVVANKVAGVRAALIHDYFSAHQGVEDDDMNLLCLGGRVTGDEMAKELILAFLKARFIGAERHLRRLDKIRSVEKEK
ncbi:MAG TPA: RpiB/LacA/LacB family sugar-phosphate isomerase [Ohtaekwangia sp.]